MFTTRLPLPLPTLYKVSLDFLPLVLFANQLLLVPVADLTNLASINLESLADQITINLESLADQINLFDYKSEVR